jgi:hypothetical protein
MITGLNDTVLLASSSSVVELFPGVESGSGRLDLHTSAQLVRTPLVVILAVMTSDSLAPLARFPTTQIPVLEV